MKPGGAALLTVAAFESLRGAHGTLSDEVRRYTTGSLSRLLTRGGLVVVRASYTHATLFPLLFVVRGWQRWRGGGQADVSESEIAVPSKPVNAVLSAMLAAESLVLPWMNLPFGSSVICLARKPR